MTPRLQPMSDEEAARFADGSMAAYVDDRINSAESSEVARQKAETTMAELFPGGRPAPGHHLYRVLDDDGRAAGWLWIGPHVPEQPDAYWVWLVEIDEAFRGRGLGRTAMLLAETEARALGATAIGLHVFGANTAARQLYASLGYETTSVTMRKELTDTAAVV
ncbi:MAG: GNAT family N-acetyltransferase [Acidimicrobiales bacterium]